MLLREWADTPDHRAWRGFALVHIDITQRLTGMTKDTLRPEPPASPPRLLVCGLNSAASDKKLERTRKSLEARLTQPETAQDTDLADWISYYLREIEWCVEQKGCTSSDDR